MNKMLESTCFIINKVFSWIFTYLPYKFKVHGCFTLEHVTNLYHGALLVPIGMSCFHVPSSGEIASMGTNNAPFTRQAKI